jgi:hypothetical protein
MTMPMNIHPGPIRCAACGQELRTPYELLLCTFCGRCFCPDHVVARGSLSSCAECEEQRTQEQDGVSDTEAERLVALLCRDLENTVGRGHEHIVAEAAVRIRWFSGERATFEQRLVDDVQQELHDSFVDTSWPRCPMHPHHPLWYSGQSWVCEQTGKSVAKLATLSYGGGRQGGHQGRPA